MIKLRLIERCSYPFCEEYHEDCEYNYLLYHGAGGACTGDEIILYRPLNYHPNKLASLIIFAESLVHESGHIINKDLDIF